MPDWEWIKSKLMTALVLALLFVAASHPVVYKLTDNFLGPYVGRVFRVAEAGCPTLHGMAIHGAVFGLLATLVVGLC